MEWYDPILNSVSISNGSFFVSRPSLLTAPRRRENEPRSITTRRLVCVSSSRTIPHSSFAANVPCKYTQVVPGKQCERGKINFIDPSVAIFYSKPKHQSGSGRANSARPSFATTWSIHNFFAQEHSSRIQLTLKQKTWSKDVFWVFLTLRLKQEKISSFDDRMLILGIIGTRTCIDSVIVAKHISFSSSLTGVC